MIQFEKDKLCYEKIRANNWFPFPKKIAQMRKNVTKISDCRCRRHGKGLFWARHTLCKK